MKIQYSILVLAVLVVFSCSKNDDAAIISIAPEYPMKYLMESDVVTLHSTKFNSVNNSELGYRFKTFKNGKITALGVRVPDNDTYRVTLWNADSEEILTTAYVTSISGLLSFEDVEPVHINSGTEYFVGLNTNDYYRFSDNGNAMFPAESNNVLILGYSSQFGSGQALPPNTSKTVYLGVVDVKFTPNN